MDIITTTEKLAELVADLAHDPYITIDTEFMREQTFWPILCLIQVAGSKRAAIIDPMAEGMDLAPLWPLLANQDVLKVFHAARQDIEIFFHLSGNIPAPVFDTQVAAMVSGFGDQVGYEAIVRKLAQVQIDKSSRFTDWSRRPLSDKQLAYALSDVTHLRVVYEKLAENLHASGRESWLVDEMATLTNPASYITEPEDAWKRVRVRLRNKRQMGVLMSLAAWREREAQSRDVPRARVLKDDAIGEIALQTPRTREALAQLRALPQGFAKSRNGDAILAAIEEGFARDGTSLPNPDERPDDLSDTAQAASEVLKLALKIVCAQEDVAPKLVASAAEIDMLASNDAADVPLMRGWRRTLFGERALDIKHGRALIGFQNGKAAIIPA